MFVAFSLARSRDPKLVVASFLQNRNSLRTNLGDGGGGGCTFLTSSFCSVVWLLLCGGGDNSGTRRLVEQVSNRVDTLS